MHAISLGTRPTRSCIAARHDGRADKLDSRPRAVGYCRVPVLSSVVDLRWMRLHLEAVTLPRFRSEVRIRAVLSKTSLAQPPRPNSNSGGSLCPPSTKFAKQRKTDSTVHPGRFLAAV